jgi:mannose-6-phosphate isomerase-like protein (cupin superfamily)
MQKVVLDRPSGEPLLVAGVQITIKIPAAATGGRYCVTESVLPPGFVGPPPHVHCHYEHMWYVLEGTLRVLVGDEVEELHAGGVAFIPVGTTHTFSTSAASGARFLGVDTPGSLEDYYRELSRAFPPGTTLDRGRVAEIQRRFDTHVDGSACEQGTDAGRRTR